MKSIFLAMTCVALCACAKSLDSLGSLLTNNKWTIDEELEKVSGFNVYTFEMNGGINLRRYKSLPAPWDTKTSVISDEYFGHWNNGNITFVFKGGGDECYFVERYDNDYVFLKRSVDGAKITLVKLKLINGVHMLPDKYYQKMPKDDK